MVTVDAHEIVLGVKHITEQMDIIIGRGVHNLYEKLIQVGEDVHNTRNFKNSFVAPVKINTHDWQIRNTADYSVVLSQGRHKVGGKWYGSLKWYYGLDPMLIKLKHDIINKFDEVTV